MKVKDSAGGLILILIGIFWLMRNFGIINWSIFGVMLHLWPLILIAIGINIIFRDKKLIKYITWGIFFIILIAFGFYQQYRSGTNAYLKTNSDLVVENRLETTRGKLKLQLLRGNVRINSIDKKLIDASIPGSRIRKDVSFSNDNSEVNIDIGQKPNLININKNKAYYCNLGLSDDILWDIDVDTGAINGTMDFSNLRLAELGIDTGASNLNLIFGDRENLTKVDIDGGVCNVEVTIPKTLGVRVDVDGLIKNTNIKSLGWNRIGDKYVSPNYEESQNKLNINIDTGIGKFDVRIK